jgi:WD40 repeat protein
VKLWNIAAQEELATLEGHAGPVDHVAFSPDGSTLATAAKSSQGTCQVFLWLAAPPEEAQSLSIVAGSGETQDAQPTHPD